MFVESNQINDGGNGEVRVAATLPNKDWYRKCVQTKKYVNNEK